MGLVQQVLEIVKKRNPNEPEFLQAVTEVLESIRPVIQRNKKYRDGKILERLVEPERGIPFRAPWVHHNGQIQLNGGGAVIRNEATGCSAFYFAQEMLKTRNETIEGKICTVSGAGNAAQFTVEKLIECGAKPITMSDSGGFIYDKNGITEEKLAWVKSVKNVRRGRIAEYAKKFRAKFVAGQRPWSIKCDCAFPCATQNEITGEDAKK